MPEKQPGAIQMLFALAAFGWLALTWDTYQQISLYGSILALFAGVTFLYMARLAGPKKELPWLFGWNDDPVSHMFMRMPVYASLFVGPVARHIAQAVAPGVFEGRKAYIVVIIVSAIVGAGTSLYMNLYKPD